MPTYRIGPGDFFTGADLRADANTLNGQVDALDRAYENGTGPISTDLADSWATFTAQWRGFYLRTWSGFASDTIAALNNSNRDQLIQFENRFESLRSRLGESGISSLASDAVKPKESVGGIVDKVTLILGLLLALVIVVAIVKTFT